MDVNDAFAISAAGMTLERTRLNVTAMNLAHMHVARSERGELYQPLRVVARPAAPSGFGAVFESWQPVLSGPVAHVAPIGAPPRQVHEPDHPLADGQGFVAYPNVDHAAEMLTLVSALRTYEANVVAMNAAKVMALKALELGGGA